VLTSTSHLRLGFPSGLFLSGLANKTLYVSLYGVIVIEIFAVTAWTQLWTFQGLSEFPLKPLALSDYLCAYRKSENG
jgi:hypothetical protein